MQIYKYGQRIKYLSNNKGEVRKCIKTLSEMKRSVKIYNKTDMSELDLIQLTERL